MPKISIFVVVNRSRPHHELRATVVYVHTRCRWGGLCAGIRVCFGWCSCSRPSILFRSEGEQMESVAHRMELTVLRIPLFDACVYAATAYTHIHRPIGLQFACDGRHTELSRSTLHAPWHGRLCAGRARLQSKISISSLRAT